MADTTPTLAGAEATLATAAADYETARVALAEAQRAETARRNDLNDAQRAFDTAVAAVRKVAPRGSDWANNDAPRQTEV